MLNMNWSAARARSLPRPGHRHRRSAIVVVLLAVALALLLSFTVAVQQGVLAGAARRVDAAALADGMWRCSSLRGRSLREACESRLKAPRPATNPELQ